MQAFITRKIGMASVIDKNGVMVPVTLLSAKPNTVLQIKNIEQDGYSAVQVGFEKATKPGKSQAGHSKKSNTNPKVIREFRIDKADGLEIGNELTAEIFSMGDIVDATGVSKGKGFAGTIKRHNFHRGRKTHGGRSYRRPGSIGSMFPQRIFPGKKMAGQMGNQRTTIKKLSIALVDMDNEVIGVKGSVPGPNKGLVLIKKSS